MNEKIYVLQGKALEAIALGANQSPDLRNFIAGMRMAWEIEEGEEYDLVVTGAQLVRRAAALPAPRLVQDKEAI